MLVELDVFFYFNLVLIYLLTKLKMVFFDILNKLLDHINSVHFLSQFPARKLQIINLLLLTDLVFAKRKYFFIELSSLLLKVEHQLLKTSPRGTFNLETLHLQGQFRLILPLDHRIDIADHLFADYFRFMGQNLHKC